MSERNKMATPKKTFSVQEFKDDMNATLRFSDCSPDIRSGIAYALAHVLHCTGNYSGFTYLEENEVPEGEKPGIRNTSTYESRFLNTDSTRIKFI